MIFQPLPGNQCATMFPKITMAAKDSTRHPRVTIEGPNRNGLPAIRLDPITVSLDRMSRWKPVGKDIWAYNQGRGTAELHLAGS